MKTRIIFRYLLKELLAPFFLGLSVFIFIMIMSQVLRLNELIIVHGVGIFSVLKLVFYLLTSFLAISIPIALLFSVLSLFGRLSADSELIAMKAAGFSIYQLAAPVLIFSIIISVFCLSLTLHVEAWGARSYQTLIKRIGKTRATIGVKQGVFNEDFFGLVLYSDAVDSKAKTLENVFIYDERDENNPLSIVAKKGTLISSEDIDDVYLVLEEGSIHGTSRDHSSLQKIRFDTYTLNLWLDQTIRSKEKPKRLALSDLRRRIREIKEAKDWKNARYYESEYYRKYAMAFISIIYAVLGISLGIKPTRAMKSGSFVYTLLLVGAYWGLFMLCLTLATRGLIPPIISMWLPNLLFLLIAVGLLYRAAKQ